MIVEDLLNKYRRNLTFYEWAVKILVSITLIFSLWFFYIPKYMIEINLGIRTGLIVALILLLVSVYAVLRLSTTDESRIKYFMYGAILFGIALQNALGIPTLNQIIIISICQAILLTILPVLSQLRRTQSFASHGKVSEEVLDNIYEANKFIIERGRWILSLSLILILVSIVSLVSLVLNELILVVLSPSIYQYVITILFMVFIIILAINLNIFQSNTASQEESEKNISRDY